jgi:hypothetical protein
MSRRISIFILFSLLFTVNSKTYASNDSSSGDSAGIKVSKFLVAKLSPKLCYEIDIKNSLLINLTSTLTLSYGIYKNDFFSAGLGISVKWLNCLVRIFMKKKNDYKIPIEFLSVHIITFDFYYVNVYFLRVPIYDLIWLLMHNKDDKNKEKTRQYSKRNDLVTNFAAYLAPVFQLNLNRIFSDFFYSEKDVI